VAGSVDDAHPALTELFLEPVLAELFGITDSTAEPVDHDRSPYTDRSREDPPDRNLDRDVGGGALSRQIDERGVDDGPLLYVQAERAEVDEAEEHRANNQRERQGPAPGARNEDRPRDNHVREREQPNEVRPSLERDVHGHHARCEHAQAERHELRHTDETGTALAPTTREPGQ